ncbi:HD domain family protein [Candida albicans]|uniref:5'-deoxynucleotidase n=1 Tax=Candida albicans TaxID=5476 RepID=A0A8H6F3C7_CANAX|nr:HD domain family protein [Candida albicans]
MLSNCLDVALDSISSYSRLGSRSFHYSTRIMNSIKDLSENVWQPQDALPKHIKDLLTPGTQPVNYMFAFLQIIRSLKFQKRTGWLDHGIPAEATESIADHMYRMGVISMLVPKEVDSNKCVKIAIVHDIAECLVGDITPYAGITKAENTKLEARYVKDIDKYEMIQTAWEYELQFGLKHNLDQFYTAREAIKTREIGDLCDALLEKRNKLIKELKAQES